ncbi:hypothetical protein L1887_48044 [Cichorium endivia]|nr:hypothetical protein L1887_48044 [Cichorium endivia]
MLLLEDATGRGQALVQDKQSTVLAQGQAVRAEQLEHNSFLLQSAAIAVKVSKGRITSIYDRLADRELIETGRSAGLAIAEDYPPQFDNWETELYSLDTTEGIPFTNVRIAEAGPWRASLALEAKFGQSTVRMSIVLDALPRHAAAWREGGAPAAALRHADRLVGEASLPALRGANASALRHRQLRDAVRHHQASHHAQHELGGGQIRGLRPQIRRPVRGGLRSQHPDRVQVWLQRRGWSDEAVASEGRHGKVVQVARVFNARFDVDYGRQSNVDIATLERSTGTASSDLQMPIELVDGTQAGVVIDTIKRAEEDFEYYGQKPKDSKSFGIVVRLYESLGAHAKPTIKISVPVKATALTNLLEDVDDKSSEELAFNTYADEKDHTYVQLDFRPFEIKTLKISL